MPALLIQTERLRLDQLEDECARALYAIALQPCVARTLFPLRQPDEAEDKPLWLDPSMQAGDEEVRLAIRWKDGAAPIGGAGFVNDRLSFFVAPGLWNRGIAREAVGALCDWLLLRGHEHIGAQVKRENLASRRVLELTGFEFTGFAEIRSPDRVLQYYRQYRQYHAR